MRPAERMCGKCATLLVVMGSIGTLGTPKGKSGKFLIYPPFQRPAPSTAPPMLYQLQCDFRFDLFFSFSSSFSFANYFLVLVSF